MKPKRKLVPLNVKKALELAQRQGTITQEERDRILNSHAKQAFKNIIYRLSGGKPAPERKMKAISKMAASRVLDDSKAGKRERPGKRKSGSSKFFDFFDFNSKCRKSLCRNFGVTFRNGEKAIFIGKAGDDIQEPYAINQRYNIATRLHVIPRLGRAIRIENPSLSSRLSRLSENEVYAHVVPNSIGYLGMNLLQFSAQEKPVLVVWTRQVRALPEFPPQLRKRFKNWDGEALRLLEKNAKTAGIEKIFIWNGPVEPRFEGQYIEFRGKARARGYRGISVKVPKFVAGQTENTSMRFMEKKL